MPVLCYRPIATLPALFEAQVRRAPTAPALEFEDRCLTYGELNRRGNRLASHLIGLGVGPDQLVAVSLPRGVELVVALLGVTKAGAAYLPLDPAYPPERIAFMLEDALPACVIDGDPAPGLASRPDSDPTDAERKGPLLPDHLAYVIYTSGSTGRPKGVAVPHAGIGNMVAAQIEALGVGPGSRVLQLASPSFDASVWEMCMALLTGGTLVIAPQAISRAPVSVAHLLRERAVTHATLGPALLASLPAGVELPAGMTIVVAGEAWGAELVDRWAPGRAMRNAYGPTETTVCATISGPLSPGGGTPPIGRPLGQMRAHVLDERLRSVGLDGEGELCVGGAGLARGYLGRPELTAERFVPDPLGPGGSRMYRTGDLVRRRADGELEFVGRADEQVKVRGFRIEPGEVEAVLLRHEAVGRAVVIAREDRPGDRRLVAYVVPAPGAEPEAARLREHAASALPEHMAPSMFVVLDDLPLTPNGKVDRRALPAPRPQSVAPEQRARTADEAVLARLFAEALGVGEVGIDDSFFDLGGGSLLSIQVLARVQDAFGVELGADALIEAPTVAALGAMLRGDRRRSSPLVRLSDGGAEPPVFVVHGGGGLLNFAQQLAGADSARPYWGLRSLGLDPGEVPLRTIDSMARRYLEEVRAVQPAGPYRLAGFCIGGLVATEMALRLDEAGEHVPALLLFEALAPGTGELAEDLDLGSARFAFEATIAHNPDPPAFEEFLALSQAGRAQLIIDKWREVGIVPEGTPIDFVDRYLAVWRANANAGREYRMERPYPGPVVLFRGRDVVGGPEDLGWRPFLPDLRVTWVPGAHVSIFFQPNVRTLAREVAGVLGPIGRADDGDRRDQLDTGRTRT